jgi:hypothetical protein
MDLKHGFDHVHAPMPNTHLSLSEQQVYFNSAIVYAQRSPELLHI